MREIADRLGNVIYWLSVALAWLLAIAAFTIQNKGDEVIPLFLGLAVASYLFGWGVRYILSGKTTP